MRKISIVILNYNNWKDTVECIESIKNQTDKDIEVIVVDNHSPNESFEELTKRYQKHDKIHLIKNDTNSGYAKGNNVGIKYSIEKLKVYNVLVINNDTIFTDKRYIEFFKNYNFSKNVGAIGTKIIGSDGKNQNPVYAEVNYRTLFRSLVSSILRYIGFNSLLKKAKNNSKFSRIKPENESFVLHGSAIFFTENYLTKAKGFYPETFLYFEENILAIIFKKLHLEMEYIGDKFIYHKEDQSSALSFSNAERSKIKYELLSIVIALKVYRADTNVVLKKINH